MKTKKNNDSSTVHIHALNSQYPLQILNHYFFYFYLFKSKSAQRPLTLQCGYIQTHCSVVTYKHIAVRLRTKDTIMQ